MAYSIMLDAGHGGQDPGAVYKGRQEKNDNLKLALAVGEILKNKGIDISYTRTGDVYQTPFEKAQLANQAGVDYFISFHRNSSPKENQYNGAEVLIYDKSGIKYQMAENILGALGEVGFREIGVKERPGLVVLRRTRMPALLIETGFINSEEDNKLFDNKFSDIAQGIADAILGSLDEETVQEPLYYRVQTGAFRKKENADRMLYQLLEKGYPSFMLHENGLYKVQTGAYQQIGSTIPTISCPTVIPGTARGTLPCLMCRSLEQILASVTFTTASRSCISTGFGFSINSNFPFETYV